jgi:hypothetical protein
VFSPILILRLPCNRFCALLECEGQLAAISLYGARHRFGLIPSFSAEERLDSGLTYTVKQNRAGLALSASAETCMRQRSPAVVPSVCWLISQRCVAASFAAQRHENTETHAATSRTARLA